MRYKVFETNCNIATKFIEKNAVLATDLTNAYAEVIKIAGIYKLGSSNSTEIDKLLLALFTRDKTEQKEDDLHLFLRGEFFEPLPNSKESTIDGLSLEHLQLFLLIISKADLEEKLMILKNHLQIKDNNVHKPVVKKVFETIFQMCSCILYGALARLRYLSNDYNLAKYYIELKESALE